MRKRAIIIIGAVASLAAVATAGTAAASQIVGRDDDRPITGEALTAASVAALASTGEGRVTATEVGDEDSYYEVEVTLDDGRQVDVQLDERFEVVTSKTDIESADDGDA